MKFVVPWCYSIFAALVLGRTAKFVSSHRVCNLVTSILLLASCHTSGLHSTSFVQSAEWSLSIFYDPPPVKFFSLSFVFGFFSARSRRVLLPQDRKSGAQSTERVSKYTRLARA